MDEVQAIADIKASANDFTDIIATIDAMAGSGGRN